MELTFLGTSSGVPSKQRNVSAAAIGPGYGKSWCLVDCGEATQHQILRCKHLSINALEAILITHMHGDHCYGLPGLLASASLNKREKPLYLIGPPDLKPFIDNIMRYSQLELCFELIHIDCRDLIAGSNTPSTVENLAELSMAIDCVTLSHRIDSYAYRFRSKPHNRRLDIDKLKRSALPAKENWGALQQGLDVSYDGKIYRSVDYCLAQQSQSVIIAGDNDRVELCAGFWRKGEVGQDRSCLRCDVLVHEATYTQDIKDKVERKAQELGATSPQHSCALEVAEFAASEKIPNLVLTHFSPRYQSNPKYSPSIRDIKLEATRAYRGNLFLAKDFARFKLGRDNLLRSFSNKLI